jgi:hypothetical protein
VNTIDPAAYEGDIVSRLRNWRGLHLAHSGELFEEAADEIERLRQSDPQLQELKRMRDMLLEERQMWRRAHMSLTVKERKAVEDAVDGYVAWMDYSAAIDGPEAQATLATLRSLLERLA